MTVIDSEARQMANTALVHIETHEKICRERLETLVKSIDRLIDRLDKQNVSINAMNDRQNKRWWIIVAAVIAAGGADTMVIKLFGL